MQDTETMNAGPLPESDGRRAALALLARAAKKELAAAWNALSPAPADMLKGMRSSLALECS